MPNERNMNSMKKILALSVALLLPLLCMLGCGDTSDNNSDDLAKADYFIEYAGQKINPGEDAKSLMPKLGSYTSEDGEACGTGEKDVIYTLSGIEIETHVSGDTEKVRQIKLLDDSVSTPEGASIGDAKDDIIKKYGKDYKEGSNGAIRYTGKSTYIEFHFDASDSVINIFVIAN